MGLTDKVSGKVKKAAGDLAGDDSDCGARVSQEERKGEAKDELARDQERADRKAEEVANSRRDLVAAGRFPVRRPCAVLPWPRRLGMGREGARTRIVSL